MAFGAHTVDHPVLADARSTASGARSPDSVARAERRAGRADRPCSAIPSAGGIRSTSAPGRLPARGRHHARVLVVRRLPAPGRPRPARHPTEDVSPTRSSARFRAGVTLPRIFCRPAKGSGEARPSAIRRRGAAAFGAAIVWSVAAFGASKALSLISLLVLARLLAPDEFGVVAAVAAYIALIELGSDVGMKPAIVYEQEEGVSDADPDRIHAQSPHRGRADGTRHPARARCRRILRRERQRRPLPAGRAQPALHRSRQRP